MRMNALLPLAGKQPNLMQTVADSYATGRQVGLGDLYRQHGEGIASNDPTAINALAGFDPGAAMGVKQGHQQMQHADQRMKWDAEKMDMVRADARRRTEAVAAGMAEGERQQAAQELQSMLRGASHFYKNGDEEGYNKWLAAQGADPAEYPFEIFPANAAAVLGSLDVLAGGDPGDRYKTVGGQLVDLQAEGGPTPVPGIDGRNAGTTVYGDDGRPMVTIGGPAIPSGQNPDTTNTPRDPGKLATSLSSNDAAFLAAEGERARSAGDIASLATQLETVAPNVGYTGPGGGIYGAIDDAIGVLPGDSGARGAFRSLAMEAQLAFTEKTKGAITDREMGMFKEAVPNLGQRLEANAKIAQVMRAGADRSRSRASFFENWARKHGSLEGAEEVWSEFIEDNPIIVPDGKGGIDVVPDKDWSGYLNRMPAASYTPQAIMQMGMDELSQVPVERMTEQQLNALEQRMQQVNR